MDEGYAGDGHRNAMVIGNMLGNQQAGLAMALGFMALSA
jgi:hypothetical protein